MADALREGDAEALFGLANELQQQRRLGDAVDCYRAAIQARPDHVYAHNNLGVALLALNRLDDAIQSFRCAVTCRPGYAEAHNNMGVALKKQGRTEEALACYAEALRHAPNYAKALLNVGTIYFERRDYAEAGKWYQASLAADPQQVEANQNMATIFEKCGNAAAAKACRDLAYGRQSIFIDQAPRQAKVVLVLWGAGQGNIPIESLLPRETVTRIVWVVEYARQGQAESLPGYDAVLNAIGDADVLGPAEEAMRRFMAASGRRVLNAPAAVARTGRHGIPALLGALDGVLVPTTERVAAPALEAALAGMPEARFPLLLRPIGSHGGDYVQKLDSRRDLIGLEPWPAEAYYLTGYHDYRSADGNFRKYRIIFVDRKPFAYHLAIGDQWLLHYETSGTADDPAKRAEEERFLNDPAAALGDRVMTVVASIGRTLDLDYCGLDFSVLADGRVLVFEANATMLVHPEDEAGPLAYKNRSVRDILAAFDALIGPA